MFYIKRFVNPTVENPVGSIRRRLNQEVVFGFAIIIAIVAGMVTYLIVNN